MTKKKASMFIIDNFHPWAIVTDSPNAAYELQDKLYWLANIVCIDRDASPSPRYALKRVAAYKDYLQVPLAHECTINNKRLDELYKKALRFDSERPERFWLEHSIDVSSGFLINNGAKSFMFSTNNRKVAYFLNDRAHHGIADILYTPPELIIPERPHLKLLLDAEDVGFLNTNDDFDRDELSKAASFHLKAWYDWEHWELAEGAPVSNKYNTKMIMHPTASIKREDIPF